MLRVLVVVSALALVGCKGEVSGLPDSGDDAGNEGLDAGDDGGAADAGLDGGSDAGTDSPLTLDTGIESGVSLPVAGDHELRVLSPTVLELVRITQKRPAPALIDGWDFVDGSTGLLNSSAPQPGQLVVQAAGRPLTVTSVGFRRRARYAPLIQHDLRLSSSIYLVLSGPIAAGEAVEVTNPGEALWPATMLFRTTADPLRLSTVIHVNQVGYGRTLPKHAQVAAYLGNLGELPLQPGLGFSIVNARSGAEVFSGTLTPRLDQGFTYTATPYQRVLQADFSALQTPGDYRVVVPGLGASYPFAIDDGIPAALARVYALGMLHQRCGAPKEMPYTRFTGRADHVAPAIVPDASSSTWAVIASESADFAANQAPGTPQLRDLSSMLYPFVRTGPLDLHGSHHDAGDYSKYTTNSAALVHALTFAADAFPGVGALDNLGLPESGDGKSDVLQLAKWEADFLARLQDDDGGFYFLVYPRDRRYEGNVTPEDGDGQLVWPKTTAATAAATAALAQLSASPRFRALYPTEAALYLDKAKRGWVFLENAIAAHGKDGAYQKITHYGNEFRHDDELVWAAVELFLATGEAKYDQKLHEWLPDPSSSAIRRWSWWRLFDGWGNALRSYAFAPATGRRTEAELDATWLAKARAEVIACGDDQLARATASAYGTSFPLESKAYRAAGWYFSSEQAFDLIAAYQLDPRPALLGAAVSNFDYEAGANPVNVSFITGLGWKRQREIVHQWAQSDLRVLPPSGIPLGNITSGFMYLSLYGSELGGLSFPSDGAANDPYPFYDRWGDTFNVTTEFVVPQLGRALGSAAALMASTPLATQAWTHGTAHIEGVPAEVTVGTPVTARLVVDALDLAHAQVVWDGQGVEPAYGTQFTFTPTVYGPQNLEAEASWPDGRRVFAVFPFVGAAPAAGSLPVVTLTATVPATAEGSTTNGKVTFQRSGPTTAPLTVRFSLGGSAAYNWDYNAILGNYWNFRINEVQIPAGAASVDLQVQPLEDSYTEPDEEVIFTLLVDPAFAIGTPGRAVVTIHDND